MSDRPTPPVAELGLAKVCYLAPGEVPEGYVATPVPGAFVAEGEPSPPVSVLLADVYSVIEPYGEPGEPEFWLEAALFSGDSVTVDGRTWWGVRNLSSFSCYGWVTFDGGPDYRELNPDGSEGPEFDYSAEGWSSPEPCTACPAGPDEPCSPGCPSLMN